MVEQISLLYTIFKHVNTHKLSQSPNIVLNNLWVENITRSKAMKEQLDMFISFDTTLEDIEILRSEMEAFVCHPDNSRDFLPDITLEATGIGNMDKLQLKVEICHKSNWHNETVRAARRSKFMCALVLALRKVPIYAPGGGGEPLGGPLNPGYSVSVSDTEAAAARDKASQAKEDKRLVPSKPKEIPTVSGELGSPSEANAADNLNSRHPATDTAHQDEDAAVRNTSFERQRGDDIEDLREGLVKRASTRGRRRPGESAPSLHDNMGPDVTLTQPSPRQPNFGQNQSLGRVIDEEAEMGMNQQPMGSGPYVGAGAYGANPYGASAGYGQYELPGQSPAQPTRPPQQQPQQQPSQQNTARRLSLNFRPSASNDRAL